MDLFKKHLLSSAAMFAPPGEGDGPNEGDDLGQEDEGLSEGEASDEGVEGDVSESDEGEDEGEDTEDGEGQIAAEPARRPSRAQSRIQTLTATAREAKEKADRLEREIQEFRAAERQRTQAAQQETATDRAARRALMDPMEVMREDLRESEQRTASLLQRQMMEQQESNDKLAYSTILRENPHFKKFEGEVERVRLEQQARGSFVPREVLLDLAIGRAARAAAAKTAPKARKEGQRRIEREQSRPARAGGDTATQRGRQGDSAEKRLENVPI